MRLRGLSVIKSDNALQALELAQWVYTSFRQDGAKLSPQQAAIEAEKLVNKLDKDGDALLSFDEFAEYFEKKVKLAKKFADKNKGTVNALAAAEEEEQGTEDDTEELPSVSDAYRKFQELDDGEWRWRVIQNRYWEAKGGVAELELSYDLVRSRRRDAPDSRRAHA